MKRSLALFLPLALVACQDAREPLAPDSADLTAPSFSQGQAGEAISRPVHRRLQQRCGGCSRARAAARAAAGR